MSTRLHYGSLYMAAKADAILKPLGSRNGDRLNACRQLAEFSPDPSTKVGAILWARNGDMVGYGWNSFPFGSLADEEYYNQRELKYDRIIHAEMRCLFRAGHLHTWGGTLYTSMVPCKDCAKHICDAGIERVYYPSACLHTDWAFRASASIHVAMQLFVENKVKIIEVDE